MSDSRFEFDDLIHVVGDGPEKEADDESESRFAFSDLQKVAAFPPGPGPVNTIHEAIQILERLVVEYGEEIGSVNLEKEQEAIAYLKKVEEWGRTNPRPAGMPGI